MDSSTLNTQFSGNLGNSDTTGNSGNTGNTGNKTILFNTHKLREKYIRKQYFRLFIESNLSTLIDIYKTHFTEDLKEDISLEDWIYFVFQNTTTDELRQYGR